MKNLISQKNILKSYKSVNDFRGIGNMWGIEIDINYSKEKDLTNLIRAQLLTKLYFSLFGLIM